MSAEIVAFLERFPPFRDLDRDHIEDLAAHAGTTSFAPDTVILRQAGEPSRSLLVVRSGHR